MLNRDKQKTSANRDSSDEPASFLCRLNFDKNIIWYAPFLYNVYRILITLT